MEIQVGVNLYSHTKETRNAQGQQVLPVILLCILYRHTKAALFVIMLSNLASPLYIFLPFNSDEMSSYNQLHMT